MVQISHLGINMERYSQPTVQNMKEQYNYVNDDSYSGTCTSDPKTECFFQVHTYNEGWYNIVSEQGDSEFNNVTRIS